MDLEWPPDWAPDWASFLASIGLANGKVNLIRRPNSTMDGSGKPLAAISRKIRGTILPHCSKAPNPPAAFPILFPISPFSLQTSHFKLLTSNFSLHPSFYFIQQFRDLFR